jgi:hypothetical protein
LDVFIHDRKEMMKRPLLVAAVLSVFVLFNTPAGAQGNSQVVKGHNIAPVPLNLSGLNPALVGLGSYIVNAQGGCNDCHTNPSYTPGGDPFLGQPEEVNAAGYLAGGTQFGPFTSRNLTPRASNGRPAGLTLDEFMKAMRYGTDFKNRHPQISPLLQVMPWPVYGKMSDRELQAIYEYLRAIPCVDPANSGRCVAP